MKRVISTSMITVCLTLCGCSGQVVKGDGHMDTKTYTVASFHAIKLMDGPLGQVDITVSDAPEGFSVNTDENLQSYVISKVEDDTLNLSIKGSYRIKPTRPIHIQVNTKQLDSLYAQEDAHVNASGLQSDHFRLESKGTTQVTLSGKANSATMKLAESTQVQARDFVVQDLQLDVIGNPQVQVYAAKTLSAAISGGNTVYFGNPSVTKRVLTGGQFQPGS